MRISRGLSGGFGGAAVIIIILTMLPHAFGALLYFIERVAPYVAGAVLLYLAVRIVQARMQRM